MSDKETLAVYNSKASDYADLTDEAGTKDPALLEFLNHLPPQSHVLDLGCGPGHAAGTMVKAGHTVVAEDASVEMIALAARHAGVEARVATFDDIGGKEAFDGVWANFSLLHAPRAKMPEYLDRLHTALKPGGLFHIGLKLGDGEKRDGLGRKYTYYSENELVGLLKAAGFTPIARSFGSDPGLDGAMADWICVLSRG